MQVHTRHWCTSAAENERRTWSAAKRTGAVASPSLRSAATGLPMTFALETKSNRSSTSYIKHMLLMYMLHKNQCVILLVDENRKWWMNEWWRPGQSRACWDWRRTLLCVYVIGFDFAGFPLFWKKKNPGVFQSNVRIFQVLSGIVRSRNIKNMRHSSLTFNINSFVTRINLNAIQPLQCQNKWKLTYTKNSTWNIKFQEFSRWIGTLFWHHWLVWRLVAVTFVSAWNVFIRQPVIPA